MKSLKEIFNAFSEELGNASLLQIGKLDSSILRDSIPCQEMIHVYNPLSKDSRI